MAWLSDEADRVAKLFELLVRSQQHEPFGLGLNDKQAVKRVSVKERKACQQHGMPAFQGQFRITISEKSRPQLPGVIAEVAAIECPLDRHFENTHRAHSQYGGGF